MKINKKGDLLIGLVIILLAVISFGGFKLFGALQHGNGKTAVITRDGKVVETINLDAVTKPYSLEIDGNYTHTVLVEPGRIRFSEAGCPEKICVRTGWLTGIGQTAVCVPDRIMIRIQGGNESGNIDSVSY